MPSWPHRMCIAVYLTPTIAKVSGQHKRRASECMSLGLRSGENDIVVTLRHVMFAHLARALGAWWLQSLEACEPAREQD